MEEKIKIGFPVIVEGKYDKQKLLSVIDGTVITLDGFGIFNNSEKIALLRRLCEKGKIIVLTDSDKAGGFIRGKLKGYLPPDSIINLYVPQIFGKEKRKKAPSKQGILGVEGMERETILRVLSPYSDETMRVPFLTKQMLYEAGLSGGEYSSEKRDRMCELLLLPIGMNTKAFSEAVNLTCTAEEYFEALKNI